jgi:hypothetical protein
MLSKLDRLTKIRFALQSASAKLNDDAIANPEGKAALEQLRIAVECAELDTQIGILSDKIWKRPRGGHFAN